MMMKAAKKLKLWSKKRKKKLLPTPPPAPTCRGCCCCSCSVNQRPSAPPLPPWLDDQTYAATSSVPFDCQPQLQEEGASEINQLPVPAMPFPVEYSLSYQQYMLPPMDPATATYGVPVGVSPAVGAEKDGATDGPNVGARLVGCLCPCFRIRDRDYRSW